MMIADTLIPQLEQLTDEELMRQVIQGSQRAFEVVVHRYQSLIFSSALRSLGDYELAEDITQSVFLQLHLSHPIPTNEYSSLKAWLLHVVGNRCKDVLRKRQRYKPPILFSELYTGLTEDYSDEDVLHWLLKMPSLLTNLPDSGTSPEEVLERRDLRETLEKAINALPERYRKVVLLRHFAQLSYAEVGRVLKMSENTAKTYFQRARPLLRTALTEHE